MILRTEPLYIEANFGPTLIDNNLVVGNEKDLGIRSHSGGTILAHNLLVNFSAEYDIQHFGNDEPHGGRNASLLKPHTLTQVGRPGVLNVENSVYNNVFIGGPAFKSFMEGETNRYEYNVLFDGADSLTNMSPTNQFNSDFASDYKWEKEDAQSAFASFNLGEQIKKVEPPMINTELIGLISTAQQGIEDWEGGALNLNTDFNLQERNEVIPGPLAQVADGRNQLSWSTDKSLTPTEYLNDVHYYTAQEDQEDSFTFSVASDTLQIGENIVINTRKGQFLTRVRLGNPGIGVIQTITNTDQEKDQLVMKTDELNLQPGFHFLQIKDDVKMQFIPLILLPNQ